MLLPLSRGFETSTSNANSTDKNPWDNKNICEHLDTVTNAHVRITCRVDLYLPPFLMVIGFVSNVLVIIVMRSKFFRSLSTSFYMTVNAVTDTASLLVALPSHYIFVNFPNVFDDSRDDHGMCAFFNIFGWGTSDLGILFTVAMTTERAIAIKYPLKAYRLCTTRRALYVVIGLTTFELVKLSHFAFKSVVVANKTSQLCDVTLEDSSYRYFYQNIWPWLHLSMLITAYVFVITGNIVIINSIRKSNHGKSAEGLGRKISSKESRSRQLSVMLVVDSLTLVICTLPFGVVTVLLERQPKLVPSAPGGKNLAFTLTFYLLYVNRCLNFFLYCVSGSRFRSALKAVFTPGSLVTLSGLTSTIKGKHSLTGNLSGLRRKSNISSQTNSFKTGISSLETTIYSNDSSSKDQTVSNNIAFLAINSWPVPTPYLHNNDFTEDSSSSPTHTYNKEKDKVPTEETSGTRKAQATSPPSRPKYLTSSLSKSLKTQDTTVCTTSRDIISSDVDNTNRDISSTEDNSISSKSYKSDHDGQLFTANGAEIPSISLTVSRKSRSGPDTQIDIINLHTRKTYL